MTKAQLSLDALLSFCCLIAAFSLLLLASRGFTSAFLESSEASSLSLALSYEALVLDTAFQYSQNSLPFLNLTSVPSREGKAMASSKRMSVAEPVFCSPSIDSQGVLHVEKRQSEPV
jgi:hypothetical protein